MQDIQRDLNFTDLSAAKGSVGYKLALFGFRSKKDIRKMFSVL